MGDVGSGRLPYEEARRELMKLHGVGPKAADCILLFAFQKYEAFPVDVWIRRIMQEHYLPESENRCSADWQGIRYDSPVCPGAFRGVLWLGAGVSVRGEGWIPRPGKTTGSGCLRLLNDRALPRHINRNL